MSYKINPNITAGFWPRFAAYTVDSLLVLLLRLVVSLFTFGFDSAFTLPVFFSYNIFDIIYFAIAVSYFTFFTYKHGATPGKKLFKLKVVDCSDNPSWINILYRETIGRFLSGFMFLGYLFMMADREHCTFSDLLCDTRVVYINMYARNTL